MNDDAGSHLHPVPPPMTYRLMHAVMCPVMKLFGLSCRQFAELTSSRMDRPLSRWESIRFRFHRAMCGLCRRLPAQLQRLRDLLRRAVCEESTPPGGSSGEVLGEEAMRRIRARIEEDTAGPDAGP